MVNRLSPCKMRGGFSGVPAIKKFFMDRLHLLDFLERGLRRFPVKNDTAAISRPYHVYIGIVSSLSAKHDIFPYLSEKPDNRFSILFKNFSHSLPFWASSA